jgi:hypothetical protein
MHMPKQNKKTKPAKPTAAKPGPKTVADPKKTSTEKFAGKAW